MAKTLSFVKLDYITVKSYLAPKNLIIFIFVAIIMGMNAKNAGVMIGYFAIVGSMFITYPFAIGEKNGMDALYSTLSIHRKNVVLGRYAFSVFMNLVTGLFAFLLAFATFTVMDKNFELMEGMYVIVTMFFIVSFIQAIQLPLCFKLGYAKAKVFLYLPIGVIPLIVVMVNSYFKNSVFLMKVIEAMEWITANPVLAVPLCLLVWWFVLYISYRASYRFYKKRDF